MLGVSVLPFTWITSDYHFGHGNIARYCGRPVVKREYLNEDGAFKSQEAAVQCAEEMNLWLILRWNARVKEGDVVYHLGDFVNYGANRKTAGCKSKPEQYEGMLNGKIIHVLGNHDINNGVKGALSSAVFRHGGVRMLMRHLPSDDAQGCDFVACGHVHNSWKHKWIGGVLNINVGVDARNWYPMRADELVGMYHKITRTEGLTLKQ